ncbi:thermonuclease family protein [Lawsonella clevelandensis]|uniref:thermonuclease family protein n=1 Tax=Lawsonella clevelandensis TaxID=1528099 RepID=UPI0030B8B645
MGVAARFERTATPLTRLVIVVGWSKLGSPDRYGRMLAYVWLGHTLHNLELIHYGYAHEATYAGPYRYQTEFKAAEKDARDHNRGLWNPSVCPQR